MLGVGGLPPPSAPPLVRKRATSIKPNFSNLIQDQAHKAHLSLDALSNYSQLSLGRTGFRLFAQKKQQGSSFRSIELIKEADFEEEDGFEIDEFDDDFDDEDGDFDEEDEDDDLMVPFHKMDAWLKNKPRGFGEGKVYDTSIEDKLLEEIEQSREAQLANVNKLKNEPKEPTSKRELKGSEGVPTGIRVRINNLPKKKNIHRDLKSAFEGVRGIINISPVVSGNKKTREPVCKGFGFLDFKSLEDANRFVQTFSGQNITFGKVQKHIKCEILKPSDAGNEGSVHNNVYKNTSKSRSTLSEDQGDQDSEQINPPLQLWEDDDFDESDEELDDEDIINISELLTSSGLKEKSTTDSASSMHEQKSKAVKKKSTARKKPDKINPPLQLWEDDDHDESDEELDDEDIVDISELLTSSGLKKKSTTDSASSMHEQRSKAVKKKSTARKKPDKINPPLQLWEDDDYDEFDEELDEDIVDISELLTSSGLKKKPTTDSTSSMHEQKSKAVKKKSTARKKPDKINPPLQLWEDDDYDESDEELDDEDIIDISELLTSSGLKKKSTTDSASSMHEQKTKAVKKKSTARKKPDKILKLNIPGSAKRLKVQEKAKLADVFSRYGSKEALASKQM